MDEVRAYAVAGDIDQMGWVDLADADPRCRVAVPAGKSPVGVVVDPEGKVKIDLRDGRYRDPQKDEIMIDYYPDPDDRP